MSDNKWFLEALMKGNAPWFIPLDNKEILIGRSTECSLILQAPSVSRKHSMIRVFGDRVYFKDLGSRNGSFINGVRITEELELRPDDIIRLGELEFIFRSQDESDADEKTQIDSGRRQEKDFISHYGLSGREEEVFYLLIKGLKIKDISSRLFISQGTAKNHVLSIYAKTDCHSRIELAQHYQNFQ